MPQSRTIDPDAARFGAILQRLRVQRGWTRRKLATRAGLSAQYIGILEFGGNVPSLTTVLELAEVLGADVGAIMRELAAARNPAPPPTE
jgi:transcriptional regulator with XRE-family HTH domain